MKVSHAGAWALAVLLFVAHGSAVAADIGVLALDPTNFASPVQNPYFPLVPGTTYFYEAQSEEGLLRTEATVTSGTKIIAGVLATVVHDVVWLDVENGPTILIEDTFDWYAPDSFGNVWYLGEATVEDLYDEHWTLIGTTTEGSWEAGVNGAVAGLIMLAEPRPGRSYRQEFAEGIAEDLAKIERLNAKVSVPYGDFSDVLVTKEWTPLEHGAVERKFYVAGVGLVLVEEFHGGPTVREQLVNVVFAAP
jgi:hypothetical protein